MSKRILEFIDYLGISTAEFERNCGLSNGSVSKMGENTRRSTIDKISNIYPQLNVNWLLTGEGNMINERNNSSIIDSNNNNRGIIQNSHGNINNGNISISLPEKGTQKIIDPDGTVTIENTSSGTHDYLNEIDMLNQRIQYLERIVSGHEATIKSLETTIKSKDDLICILRGSLDKQD